MNFINASRFEGAWTMGFRRDGREQLIAIAKATYTLPAPGRPLELAPQQQPLTEEDRFSGAPGESAPTHETDYAHEKPACDVLLLGSAYAGGGRATRRVVVGLQVGSMEKQFAAIGPRVWRRRLAAYLPSAPEHFLRLPIGYDDAFGGIDRSREDRGRVDTFERNPVGRGYGRHADAIDGRPLPTTEQIGVPVVDPSGDYAPMAFSPCGRSWMPRRRHAGTYDQAWRETTAPLWPDDFDTRYFQAAPADQQIPYPRGGEPVVLRNLTSDGIRAFRLPPLALSALFIPHRGRDVTLDARCDTIVLEPDADRFTVTWRAVLPLARSVFDVKELVIGASAELRRARRFPGKTYYASLGEAVRARRNGVAR